MSGSSDDHAGSGALAVLDANQQAVWSHLHGERSPRRPLGVLSAAERDEAEEFARAWRWAKELGFGTPRRIIDSRGHRSDRCDESRIVLSRVHEGVQEVLVIWSATWGQAYRVALGSSVLEGTPELEEEPAVLRELIEAGRWDAQPSTRDVG